MAKLVSKKKEAAKAQQRNLMDYVYTLQEERRVADVEELEKRCEELEKQVQGLKESKCCLEEDLEKNRAELAKSKENFARLLASAHNSRFLSNKEIECLKAKLESSSGGQCPKCKAPLGLKPPPEPEYVKIIRGKQTVEVLFSDNSSLDAWVRAVGLSMNADGLPTIPEDVATFLQKKDSPMSLGITDSLLLM